MTRRIGHARYLAGSPLHMERVCGVDECARAQNGELTHLLINHPPLCDCNCRRCFMPTSRRGRVVDALSLQEYCRVIEHAREAGMRAIEVSGEGEPLLSEHIREFLSCAASNGFITTLITNGHLLTPEFVEFAFERNVTLVVSLFSLNREMYEHDNRLAGSFDRAMHALEGAAQVYRHGWSSVGGNDIYRIAVHTTAQADNADDLEDIRSFCSAQDIFFSVAPLAPVGGGAAMRPLMLSDSATKAADELGDNSIILSATSEREIGRRVCGTCLYGLNISYDGSLLFDAHAGYEVGGLLGSIRRNSIKELVRRQRLLVPLMFRSIAGFCPVRDDAWPEFLSGYLANPIPMTED